VSTEILSDRALNRATLSRQLLLERSPLPVVETVGRLVGLQAQEPLDPYYALWSRLGGFRPDDLVKPFVDRELVRVVAMRGTIHLLTADDCLGLRHIVQPILDEELTRHSGHKHALKDLDLTPVLAFARPFLASPRPLPELKKALAAEFPDLDAPALAYACRNHLILVQVPPRGVWGQTLQVTYAEAAAFLGRPIDTTATLDDLVLRYLAAFGPAATPDVATWCRLKAMREVMDRLRPRLRIYRDERGRELFDLPDISPPDPDTPAPIRFLPEYDNVLLSHADRSRFVDRAEVGELYGPHDGKRHYPGTVLIDGRVGATWWIEAGDLRIDHLGPFPKATRTAIEAEGHDLLRFATDGTGSGDVVLRDLAATSG
jgi:hypothetical protein